MTDQPAAAAKERSPALDGLRGLAVIAVIGYHLHLIPGGRAGVDMFFVLSGFLITSSLAHRSLRAFYAARIRRLGPALAVFLLVWLGLAWKFGTHPWFYADIEGRAPVTHAAAVSAVTAALTFTVNIQHALRRPATSIGHLWSLSVEEQFYLLWPGFLILTSRVRPRLLLLTIGGVAALSALTPTLLGLDETHARTYFGTDTRIVGLLVGSLLALAERQGLLDQITRRTATGLTWGGLVLFGLLACKENISAFGPFSTWGGLAVLGAVVIAGIGAGGTTGLLCFSWLRWAGRRSYALYLWHYPLQIWMRHASGHRSVTVVLIVLACGVIAELSWRFVERPLNRQRPVLLPQPELKRQQ